MAFESKPWLPFGEGAPTISVTQLRPRRRRQLSREARASGHRLAQQHADRQANLVIAHLQSHGPCTDHELADALGLPLASINSTRNALMRCHRVIAFDIVQGARGAWRTRWHLAHGPNGGNSSGGN
jgi:hypothetical protein